MHTNPPHPLDEYEGELTIEIFLALVDEEKTPEPDPPPPFTNPLSRDDQAVLEHLDDQYQKATRGLHSQIAFLETVRGSVWLTRRLRPEIRRLSKMEAELHRDYAQLVLNHFNTKYGLDYRAPAHLQEPTHIRWDRWGSPHIQEDRTEQIIQWARQHHTQQTGQTHLKEQG